MEDDGLQGRFGGPELAEVLVEMETSTTPGTEEDFKPQKANAKRVPLVDKCGK